MTTTRADVKTAVWAGSILIGIVILSLIFRQVIAVVLMVFAAVLLAIFLDGLAGWIQRHTRMTRAWSMATVMICLILVSGGLLALSIPLLAAQVQELGDRLPKAASQAKETLEQAGVPQRVFRQASSATVASRAARFAVSGLDAVVSFFVVGVVGLYLAWNPKQYRQSVLRVWPGRGRGRLAALMDDIGCTLRRWVMARILLMLSNGILTTIGLFAIGVPLAPILGVLAGLLNFVPNLGPIIASIPAILLGLTEGPGTAGAVAVLYFVLQMLDGYVLTPLVEQRAVSLPPALILVFQVLMGLLLGTGGVLLATPMLASLKVVFNHVDPDPLPPA